MKILVINAGSSSLKYQLIDMTGERLLAKGLCDRIGIEGGTFKHTPTGGEQYKIQIPIPDHEAAVRLVIKTLTDEKLGVISSMSEIGAVGHRVLHGGEKFSGAVVIDEKVIAAIEECCELGPLHNPANLTGIRACREIMGDVTQVAVFDTGFHQTMPDYVYLYALPYEYYEKYRIRRYGFHGTSHRYVSMRAAEVLGRPAQQLKIVTCHLGNGSSVAAVDGGKCFDTSMGVTPLEGLMMGTRCGSIDPAIVPLIMQKENLTPAEMDTIMNKKSGILGVSQRTSDNRDIEQGARAGDERCILIENMLVHQITKYIGAYAAAMGGIDAVVFTGGIGENNPHYRERIAEKLRFMGAHIDSELNAGCRGENCRELDMSLPDASLRILVIPTNEELMIAKDTYELAK